MQSPSPSPSPAEGEGKIGPTQDAVGSLARALRVEFAEGVAEVVEAEVGVGVGIVDAGMRFDGGESDAFGVAHELVDSDIEIACGRSGGHRGRWGCRSSLAGQLAVVLLDVLGDVADDVGGGVFGFDLPVPLWPRGGR